MEEIKEIPIKVYVKTNINNEVVEVASSIFLKDTTGWIEIDAGFGDRFAHAQSQYFNKSLINDDQSYNYKYINNKVIQKEL